MATLKLKRVPDGLSVTTSKSPLAVIPISSSELKIDHPTCYIWRKGHLVGVGLDGVVLNSAGVEIGTVEYKRPKRKSYEVPKHVDTLPVRIWNSDAFALRHSVDQFGFSVPVYFFTQMQIMVDYGVWQAILSHVDSFCSDRVDRFERLAQAVGHFLAPAVDYTLDTVFDGAEEVVAGDDFSCPVSSPFGNKVGDCEDFAILSYCMFNNLKLCYSNLIPECEHYVAVLADCVIQESGLHMCCLLVPDDLFDHWVTGAEVKSERAHNPILLLESTERSLSSLNPKKSLEDFYMKCVRMPHGPGYEDVSFLYPAAQYREEDFYTRFFSLYTNGHERCHYVPCIDDHVGFSLCDLMDERRRLQIRLNPRFEKEDLAAARRYLATCLPPNLRVTAHAEREVKESRKDKDKKLFPFYYSTPRALEVVSSCFPDLKFDGPAEKVHASPCFRPMYVVYAKQ